MDNTLHEYVLGTALLAVTLLLLSINQPYAALLTGMGALVMLGRVLWRVL
jgi:hypothetical protein